MSTRLKDDHMLGEYCVCGHQRAAHRRYHEPEASRDSPWLYANCVCCKCVYFARAPRGKGVGVDAGRD